MAKTETKTEETNAVAEREIDVLGSKLTIKHVGDPKKAIAMLPDNEAQAVLGEILGMVDGIGQAKNPDQLTTHRYLKGIFQAVPTDGSKSIKQSGKCILHDSLQKPIEELFDISDEKTGQVVQEADAKKRTQSLQFKFQVLVVRATNAQGYSWAFKPIVATQAADPLAALRNMTAAEGKLLAAAPAQAQIAAPVPAE